jgi:hypothetical protein
MRSLDLSGACKLRETLRESPLRSDPKLVPRRPFLPGCRASAIGICDRSHRELRSAAGDPDSPFEMRTCASGIRLSAATRPALKSLSSSLRCPTVVSAGHPQSLINDVTCVRFERQSTVPVARPQRFHPRLMKARATSDSTMRPIANIRMRHLIASETRMCRMEPTSALLARRVCLGRSNVCGFFYASGIAPAFARAIRGR